MHFKWTSEQAQLRDVLQRFLRDHDPGHRGPPPEGWRPELWRRLGAELGVLGAGVSEACGGTGGGAVAHGVVMEALGEALAPEPYVEAVVLAGPLLSTVADARAAQAWAQVLQGEGVVVLAGAEGALHDTLAPTFVAAHPLGADWRLDGIHPAVVGAPWAQWLLVVAQLDGAGPGNEGLSIFLIDRDTPGLTLRSFHTLDGRRAADLVLAGAQVPASALLHRGQAAQALLAQAFDAAVAAQCAEALGLMTRMLRDTVAHVSQRRQFGQTVASFQVVQHRLADMRMQLELARSATYGAALAPSDAAERARAASAAKVTVDDALRFVGQNAIQLHGGMGMSEATPVTQAFRRATVISASLGHREAHLARFMRLEAAARVAGCAAA